MKPAVVRLTGSSGHAPSSPTISSRLFLPGEMLSFTSTNVLNVKNWLFKKRPRILLLSVVCCSVVNSYQQTTISVAAERTGTSSTIGFCFRPTCRHVTCNCVHPPSRAFRRSASTRFVASSFLRGCHAASLELLSATLLPSGTGTRTQKAK